MWSDTQKGFGSSSTHTSTKLSSKENSFHVTAITEEYHFAVQNHYGIDRHCINLVYITQSSVHQLKINWVFWKEWYILLIWGFHVGNFFFSDIGVTFICKTSPTANDSDLRKQPQREGCLVNDELAGTYWFYRQSSLNTFHVTNRICCHSQSLF